MKITLNSSPSICIAVNPDSFLRNMVKKYNEEFRIILKMHLDIQCEIKQITDAYFEQVCEFKTIKTLLKENPDLKKFIPKVKQEIVVPKSKSENDKLISKFEEQNSKE